ncbi:DUF1284 domain-containing protein [Oscillospiraceae bacterium MB08-C2-2]|nr:DUF1284 domain-containing protein [Oscillospiraceae bacterium MB08-C2-2]
MKLRPHHLLCTQGYSGRGYSEEFVANMNRVTDRLRNHRGTEIKLTFSTDDICSACPHKLGEGLCRYQEKVLRYDSKVTSHFALQEKTYTYDALIEEIRSRITGTVMDDICADCAWYPVSACRKNLLAL